MLRLLVVYSEKERKNKREREMKQIKTERRRLIGRFSVLLLLCCCYADESIGLCCLCEGCGPPVRDTLYVDDKGKTCNELGLELADPSNGSKPGNDACLESIRRHRRRCCDPGFTPLEIVQSPTTSPKMGVEPLCHICKDGSFPKLPYSQIVTLPRFIDGVKTCEELYEMGKYGFIPDQICKPLVKFAEVPCGCEPTTEPTREPKTSLFCDGERGNLNRLRG